MVAYGTDDISAWTEYEAVRSTVHRALGELDAREATILSLRFGIADGKERTLEDVGSMLGVTRERIRQLQNIALGHLREDDRLAELA